jgi:hypothetical protein
MKGSKDALAFRQFAGAVALAEAPDREASRSLCPETDVAVRRSIDHVRTQIWSKLGSERLDFIVGPYVEK